MTFQQTLKHITALEKFGSVPGLDNMRALMNKFANPQDKLSFIHVTGTNGKGSTSQFIASALIAAGYKVGVFSSPSIKDYRERIKINNEMISPEDFTEIAKQIIKTEIHCTEFEFSTAAAFIYFYRQNCDYVVLEVGMGGLLDSTNIVKTTEVAVLTPISLDHTAVLGNSLSEITEQKCGIIKPCSAVVSSVQSEEVAEIIKAKAPFANFVKSTEILSTGLQGTLFKYEGKSYKIKLLGLHQVQNAATAIEALKILGIKNPNLENAFLPYRFQQAGDNLFYDAAHNVAGAQALASCIDTYLPNRTFTLVMGMLKDKEYEKCVEILAKKASKFVAITPTGIRGLPKEELAKIARNFCKSVELGDGLPTNPNELTICCGSFSIFN